MLNSYEIVINDGALDFYEVELVKIYKILPETENKSDFI